MTTLVRSRGQRARVDAPDVVAPLPGLRVRNDLSVAQPLVAVQADVFHAVVDARGGAIDQPVDGTPGDEGNGEPGRQLAQRVDDAFDGDGVVGMFDEGGDGAVEVEYQQRVRRGLDERTERSGDLHGHD